MKTMPIKGYENYLVNEKGEIFNSNTNKKLRTRKKGDGYIVVDLHYEGKRYTKRVHRIVAETFIEKTGEDIRNKRNQVDHINGNREDNRVENLRWCNAKENNNFPLARENKSKAQRGLKKKRRKVVVNGVVYKGVTDCARKFRINDSLVYYRINSKTETFKEWYFIN